MTTRTRIPEYLKNKDFKPNFNHKEELEQWLKEFGIQKSDICLIGSIPLSLAGIRKNEDIDFITTKDVKKRILNKVKKHPKCKVKNGKIYFGDEIHSGPLNSHRFDYLELKNEDIIHDEKYHMLVDGFKIFRLELLLTKKTTEKRPKDLKDVKKLEESDLIGGPGWDWDLVYSLPAWKKSKIRSKKSTISTLGKLIKDQSIKKSTTKLFNSFLRKLGMDEGLDDFLSSYNKLLYMKKIYNFKNHYKYFQLKVPIPLILSNYIIDGKFYGWDIIMEYSLKSYELPGIEKINSKRRLMEKIGLKGDYHSPIVLSEDGKIVKGRSNFVEKINENKYRIEIEIEDTSIDIEADKEWLKNTNLTNNQIKFLERERQYIFEKSGLVFYAILWPSAQSIFDEITTYVKNRVKVIETKKYDISTNFSETIHKLYSYDDRAKEWRIENKINELKGHNEIIRVLKLWLPDPNFRYHLDSEGVAYSKITRDLKNDCRKRFHNKIDNYVYDNLIHITETYKSNYHTSKVLENIDKQ